MMITEGIEQYAIRRRSEGITFERGEKMLHGLRLRIGEIKLDELRSTHVLDYLDDLPLVRSTWRLKYQQFLHFFNYWAARGEMPGLPMPPQRPMLRQTYIPHIYSRAELRKLTQATRAPSNQVRSIDPQTARVLLLLLYGTGAMTGEVISLMDRDVTLTSGLLSISFRQGQRSRQIPIGRDLADVIQKYRNWRSRNGLQGESLLVTRLGRPLTGTSVVVCFARLRRDASLAGIDALGHRCRLSDLRFTFAVHRITSWIRNGPDLNRMLPALAAYMGQVGLGATDRYLSMTPERFRKELNRLSPAKAAGHWRDKPDLMKFIAGM